MRCIPSKGTRQYKFIEEHLTIYRDEIDIGKTYQTKNKEMFHQQDLLIIVPFHLARLKNLIIVPFHQED